MGIADEKLAKRREKYGDPDATHIDYTLKLLFRGWIMFSIFGILFFFGFGYGIIILQTNTFGSGEGLALVGYAYTAIFTSILGFFVGQLVGLRGLFKKAKKWEGNLNFGKHPTFFLPLVSIITFNIIFFIAIIYLDFFAQIFSLLRHLAMSAQ